VRKARKDPKIWKKEKEEKDAHPSGIDHDKPSANSVRTSGPQRERKAMIKKVYMEATVHTPLSPSPMISFRRT